VTDHGSLLVGSSETGNCRCYEATLKSNKPHRLYRHRRRHRRDEGDRSPHFSSSIVSFAVSGWIIPREQTNYLGSLRSPVIPPLANLSRRTCLQVIQHYLQMVTSVHCTQFYGQWSANRKFSCCITKGAFRLRTTSHDVVRSRAISF
jgi:hypothetical protein